MNPIFKSIVIGLTLAGTIAAAQAAEYKPRIVRFGYGLAEDSNQGRAVRYFADEMGKLTGGKWKVKAFGAAALGSDPQMQNALIGGAQEMMVGSPATLVGIVSDFGVYDLPFVFTTDKEADTVLDGPFGQKLLDSLQPKGMVGLVYWENGFRDLTNSKRPVAKMEDMQGIKLRVMQNPVYIDMFKGFGANAVPLAFSELFAALETGAVDGQENPVTTIESSKFYEVQKYLSITHHVYSPWVVTVSKKWYDGLSADEKAALKKAAIASRDFERKDSREAAAKAMTTLKQKGMQINTMSDAEVARLRATTKPAIDKFAADGHAQVVKDLQAELAKLRK
jgi:tripartite ATP-independent transporter DctP family solute receptor